MTIRVRVTNGVLVPLDPLPAAWREGDQFPIERNGHEAEPCELGDDYWNELDRLASEVDVDDWNNMQSALDAHRREAKEWMSRQSSNGK